MRSFSVNIPVAEVVVVVVVHRHSSFVWFFSLLLCVQTFHRMIGKLHGMELFWVLLSVLRLWFLDELSNRGKLLCALFAENYDCNAPIQWFHHKNNQIWRLLLQIIRHRDDKFFCCSSQIGFIPSIRPHSDIPTIRRIDRVACCLRRYIIITIFLVRGVKVSFSSEKNTHRSYFHEDDATKMWKKIKSPSFDSFKLNEMSHFSVFSSFLRWFRAEFATRNWKKKHQKHTERGEKLQFVHKVSEIMLCAHWESINIFLLEHSLEMKLRIM